MATLAPANGAWTETPLHNFDRQGGDGVSPYGRVVVDESGNLFGTTPAVEYQMYNGTAFELTPAPSGQWTENVLYPFPPDSGHPTGGLTWNANHTALIGTTSAPGTATAYEITLP